MCVISRALNSNGAENLHEARGGPARLGLAGSKPGFGATPPTGPAGTADVTRVSHQPVQEPVASKSCRGYVSGAEGKRGDADRVRACRRPSRASTCNATRCSGPASRPGGSRRGPALPARARPRQHAWALHLHPARYRRPRRTEAAARPARHRARRSVSRLMSVSCSVVTQSPASPPDRDRAVRRHAYGQLTQQIRLNRAQTINQGGSRR